MQVLSSLIALAVLGADGSPETRNESLDGMMRARVHIFEMDGLSWRDTVHHKLSLAGQRENTTIWTAPLDVLETLTGKADKVLAAPRVVANCGSPAMVSTRTVRHYVSSLRRIADGPVGEATNVSFQPEVESLTEGFTAEITGRALDQGILATVELEDVWCVAFHTATFRDSVKPDQKSTEKSDRPTSIQANYQVPEVTTTRVSGEWLIPRKEILVISLGTQTVPGKPTLLGTLAQVRERIAVFEVESNVTRSSTQPPAKQPGMAVFVTPIPPVTCTSSIAPVACAPLPVPSPIPGSSIPGGIVGIGLRAMDPMVRVAEVPFSANDPQSSTLAKATTRGATEARHPSAGIDPTSTSPLKLANKAHPKLPSRHLPQAFDAEGDPVVLPPLPDETAAALAAEAETASPGEPRPSPQSKTRKPSTDQAASLASGARAEITKSEGTIELKGRVTIRTQDGLVIEADSIVLRPSCTQTLSLPETAPPENRGPDELGFPSRYHSNIFTQVEPDSDRCSDTPHPPAACEGDSASCRYEFQDPAASSLLPESAEEVCPVESKSSTSRVARNFVGYPGKAHPDSPEALSDLEVDPANHSGERRFSGRTYQYRIPMGAGLLEIKVQVGHLSKSNRDAD